MLRHRQTLRRALAAGALLVPAAAAFAQGPVGAAPSSAEVVAAAGDSMPEPPGDCLPAPVTDDHFAELLEHSPFLRNLNLSNSLILTGVAWIEDEAYATLLDVDTRKSYIVSREANLEGWQLVEVKGNQSDLETLTARIKVGGAEIVSIRYEKAPPPAHGYRGVVVSSRIGNGTPGGGTGPHGGPDPRVLTPDQLNDARNAARNIREGFKADGYGDRETIPSDVVDKISRLSIQQRESINVKMYEYRNRGLGMDERKKIYNGLLDRELRQR